MLILFFVWVINEMKKIDFLKDILFLWIKYSISFDSILFFKNLFDVIRMSV